MDSSGGAGAEPDPRQQLQKDYPDWRVWRDGDMEKAWWAMMPSNKDGPEGLLRLEDASVAGLRARMKKFLAVWHDTYNRAEAEEAARALIT